jgi:hypothetical protein
MDGWVRKKGPAPPAGALALFIDPRGDVIVVAKGAIYRLADDAGRNAKTKGKGGKFVRSGPDPALRLDPSAVIVQDPDTGAIAAFSQGTVTVLEPDVSGTYTRKIEKTIAEAKGDKTALLAIGGEKLLLALADGQVLIFDAATLELQHQFRPQGEMPPRFAAASPGGRWFSVLFHNRTLWLCDLRQGKEARTSFSGQGNISAAAFSGPDQILVADRGKRITEYQLDPFRAGEARAPALSNMEVGYYYGLLPLYAVFPKPGELGKAVAYLLKDSEVDDSLDPRPKDLSRAQDPVDVASPIWSSLGFLTVTLIVSCLYVWRTDF